MERCKPHPPVKFGDGRQAANQFFPFLIKVDIRELCGLESGKRIAVFSVPVNVIPHEILHVQKVQPPHRVGPQQRGQTRWFFPRVQFDLKIAMSQHLRRSHHSPLRNGINLQRVECADEMCEVQIFHHGQSFAQNTTEVVNTCNPVFHGTLPRRQSQPFNQADLKGLGMRPAPLCSPYPFHVPPYR